MIVAGMWLQAVTLGLVALADALGVRAAVWTVAAITAMSGAVVAARMDETRPARPAHTASAA